MLSDFFTLCCMIDKVSKADGYGGVEYTYQDGAKFSAGISTDTSTEATIAYQQGLKAIYTIVVESPMVLSHNDMVKRLSDGTIFRVTSDSKNMTTPTISTIQYSQVTAEVVTP